MKKYISNISILFAFLLILSSCHGVIFDEVRNEVKLSDAKASGQIQNIIRYSMPTKITDSEGNTTFEGDLEYVFAAPGKIYYRCIDTTYTSNYEKAEDTVDEETGEVTQKAFYKSIANKKKSFGTFKKPSGHVFSIGADSEHLYALSSIIEDDDDGDNVPTNCVLWCYNVDSKEWVSIWSESPYTTTTKNLMSTNTPQKNHRQAFFRYGTTIWNLNGTTKLTEENARTDTVQSSDIDTDNGDKFANYDNKSTPTYGSKSCAYFGGTVYFSSAYAMTTDETFDSEASHIYYSSSDNVYYSTDASEWTAVDLSCGTIYSLAVTSDYLLAGTSSGIVHTPWESEGVPKSGNADFSTNAASTLSSYYEIRAVLVIEPSLPEYDTTIFASAMTTRSSASLGNVGLWSFFDSTNEWNRE